MRPFSPPPPPPQKKQEETTRCMDVCLGIMTQGLLSAHELAEGLLWRMTHPAPASVLAFASTCLGFLKPVGGRAPTLRMLVPTSESGSLSTECVTFRELGAKLKKHSSNLCWYLKMVEVPSLPMVRSDLYGGVRGPL